MEKSIVHICVPTKHDLVAWMTGIRLAKVIMRGTRGVAGGRGTMVGEWREGYWGRGAKMGGGGGRGARMGVGDWWEGHKGGA